MIIVPSTKLLNLFRVLVRLDQLCSQVGSEKLASDEKKLRDLKKWFSSQCDDVLGALQLVMSQKSAERMLRNMNLETTAGELQPAFAELHTRIEDELGLMTVLCLKPEQAKMLSARHPLGVTVANSFPSSQYDAAEAASCLSLGRSTACVFHLMRVLEIGLKALGLHFGVIGEHTNWQTILDRIESAVRDIPKSKNKPPNWKTEYEYLMQVVQHFIFLKDAWRNYTAHSGGKHTSEEAEIILANVGSFMRHLAKKFNEAPHVLENVSGDEAEEGISE